ncbi:MAG: glycosyltransferase family 4 protein [Candidatus Omnitrophica bacterium]|nr:glycosyltransferase family 4 protein [Candidatus Omnitrophota bacterium]
MNILYLTNHLNIGGITSYVYTLSRGMQERGHSVFIASSGGELCSLFQEAGITLFIAPIKTKSELSPKLLASMLKLYKPIKKNKIELIHAHSRTTQVLAHYLSSMCGIPYLSTCHGFFKKRFSRRKFPCWGKHVIAISSAVKDHLVHDFCVSPKNITVVHNGIDAAGLSLRTESEIKAIKEKLGLRQGPVIGIIARLSDVKGHQFLIQAMKTVIAQFPTASLLIVGEGKMKTELAMLVERLGLKENVVFLSQVLNTQETLSVMDVFVMPSLQEGLGLALMEAMGCGLPVVGSAVGGIVSLIQHNVNGLLVKPADAQGLAEAILALLTNPLKAQALGVQANAFIKEHFSREAMVYETERVYRLCLEQKR